MMQFMTKKMKIIISVFVHEIEIMIKFVPT